MTNNQTIVLVIGLPGSGKTTYLDNLKAEHPEVMVIDDIVSLDQLPESFSGTLYLSSPQLCLAWRFATSILQEKYPGATIDHLYFENDPETCIARVKARHAAGDNRVISEKFILNISNKYVIPADAKIIRLSP
jgi:predicted kinase